MSEPAKRYGYRLGDAIADVINDNRNNGWYGSVCGSEIKRVTVRQGCGEIDVEYEHGDQHDTVTIDAAPILTHVLTHILERETW